MKRVLCSAMLFLALSFSIVAADANNTQYKIGVGDVLQLNVWQVPSLDRQIAVRPDGMIVLPMAGELKAEGRTLVELERQIVDRLRDFNRNVSEVSLSVTEYRSRSIYVLGRVVKPGKYSYADEIKLFDLVREAGGFLEDALRSRVKLVHRVGDTETIEYVNVELALNNGTLNQLPSVRAGDTVIIPKRVGSGYAGREGVQLIGEVRSPSIYPLENVNDLVGFMLMAGGPTDQANLKKVRLVRRSQGSAGSTARRIDVTEFLENGVLSSNPKIEAGDTIFVPRRPRSWYRTLRTASLLLGTVGSGLGLYFALNN